MQIQSTDKKTLELTDDSKKPGHIIYEGLFSYKAKAIVSNTSYDILPKGIFSTSISVTRGGNEVANMKISWKGHIIISLENGQEFLLKATGTFLNKYVLEDKDQQKILLLDPSFSWKSFNYSFNISYDNKPQDILLVLLAVYSASYSIAVMSEG